MSEIELRRCPFCVGKAIFSVSKIVKPPYRHEVGFNFFVECGSCQARLPEEYCTSIRLGTDGQFNIISDERENAAKAWNRRVGERNEID